MLLSIGTACEANYRADFFDTSRTPSVQFDKKTMIWTLRNDAVERTLRFDPKSGSLHTLVFRSLRTGHRLEPSSPAAEGEIRFVAPILKPPSRLTGWQTTLQPPPAEWTRMGFDARSWSQSSPFPASTGENRPGWSRTVLPQGAIRAGHAYALLFDHSLAGDAEVRVDGALIQTVSADESPWNHVVQVDLPANARVVSVYQPASRRAETTSGEVLLAEVGTAPPPLNLDSDWIYSLHSVNTGDDNSRILTISLEGVHRYEGFSLDVSYQIHAGAEPTLAKWFTLVNHRQTRFLIENVIFDRWRLPGFDRDLLKLGASALSAADVVTHTGLMTAVLSPMGECRVDLDGTVAASVWPYTPLAPDQPQELPHAISALYHGPAASGAFLYQLYAGQYLVHATPTSVPTLFDTGPGYGTAIDDSTCRRIVPLAADLGVGLFVLGDGWQTDNGVDRGRYGDWIVDRRPGKFPDGLLPISNMVREHNMRFGLWVAPIIVDDRSDAAQQHPDWLLSDAAGRPIPEWAGTHGMSLASAWTETWGTSVLMLCRELSVSFLKVAGPLFQEDWSSVRDSPIGHVAATEVVQWRTFAEHARSLDPAFVLDRALDSTIDFGPVWAAIEDEGHVGVGTAAKRAAEAVDGSDWPAVVDRGRSALLDLALWCPAFALSATAPCHVASSVHDANALEYALTSACATGTNVELGGRLEQMTADDAATVRKWVGWNREHRAWLAYAEPLSSVGKPWHGGSASPGMPVDAMLHLRNVLDGRYGYLCLWNPAPLAVKASVAFDPEDYWVHLDPHNIEIVRLSDSAPVRFGSTGGTIALSDLTMGPRSWEIFEIRKRGWVRDLKTVRR